MVWGGRRLEQVLGKPLPTDEPYGEAWELSDHPLHRSTVATGRWAGRTVRELMESDANQLLGSAASFHSQFPWLIKFLDCNDWLSVQVHPDDVARRRLGIGDGSKTEAWFILDAAPGSRIYAGLKPGTDERVLKESLRTGTVADCLGSFEPKPGDCFFLPAGTVHAVGGGVLMAEVQQTSDTTFRLFDWGRPRPLHVDEAVASIRWDFDPVEPMHVDGFAATPTANQSMALVRCPYFYLNYHQFVSPSEFAGNDNMQVVVVLHGDGSFISDAGVEPISAGQAWLLPAAMPKIECRPKTTLKLLHCRMP